MKNSSRSLVALVIALVACFALGPMVACDTPDPEGEFNRFGQRTAEDRRLPDMGTEEGQQVKFSGTYLLALVTPISGNPILMRTDISVSEDFEIDFVFQPLKSDYDPDADGDRPDAREEVGDEIIVTGVQLEEDGTFEADMGTVSVDGTANPISGGNILADIVLQGTVLGREFFCGSASGDVQEPTALPLAGSTFGTVWISMDGDIEELEVVTGCPMAENNVNNDTDMGTEPGVDECLGGDDLAIIEGEEVDQSAEAQSCGLGNLSADDPVEAAQACIVMETGLSEGCSRCYAETVGCSIDNCLSPCGADAAGEACRECQVTNGCIAAFEECSGIVPPVVDACLGDADLGIIEGEDVDQSAEAQTCGLGNLSADDPVAAAQECIEMETGLSRECSFCYAQTVGCSIDNCLSPCGADPSGEPCRMCQVENGCISQFEECSGIVSEEE